MQIHGQPLPVSSIDIDAFEWLIGESTETGEGPSGAFEWLVPSSTPRIHDVAPIRIAATEAASIHRRSVATMTATEWATVQRAFEGLRANGIWQQFARYHVDWFEGIHGMGSNWGAVRFLPWHRAMLFVFEQHLRSIEPTVALPYWDWVATPRLPNFVLNFAPTASPWSRIQRPPAANGALPTASEVNRIQGLANFLPSSVEQQRSGYYSHELEVGPHNRVHLWVHGIMAEGDSPIDPLFFLHHANIDRLWARWQNTHPGQHPNLSSSPWGLEMRPFTGWTEPRTRDTATMGYDYV